MLTYNNYSVIQYETMILTLWYLKKVLRDRQLRPIWEKAMYTFDADPTASKSARQRRKLPSGIEFLFWHHRLTVPRFLWFGAFGIGAGACDYCFSSGADRLVLAVLILHLATSLQRTKRSHK